mgnify:CR=1 FL=1
MPRVKRGVTARARHKKYLRCPRALPFRRNNVYRVAKQAVMRAGQYAYRDRRNKKRVFRRLWIARINAGARANGMNYSQFMNGSRKPVLNSTVKFCPTWLSSIKKVSPLLLLKLRLALLN